ncbi:MAG: thioredoxin domain-containing protein [Intestinibacillus sp.]
MNHLRTEKSPYLLQHAGNPVDWYPWGTEAFARAKAEDKPVFLSIGYSTCHWCHVMAHESFEDAEAAAALNRDFICVKVDREERPDIDAVYMKVCQALTGSGGWPLTVLLTPEQKPFWAGTYLPKTGRYGMMGLLELLAAVKRQWDGGRARLLEAGDEIAALLRQEPSGASPAEPDRALLRRAEGLFRQSFDARWGGFGAAPKFPAAHNLLFLLRYAALEHAPEVQEMAGHTLVQMYRGGLFDHVGGGFSRYSTDEKWLVPHFEKMLYDNALLACAYAEAYGQTGRPLYRRVVSRTLDYVLRELTDGQGGFYCGQDADSDGVEGKYYVFTPAEVRQVLGEADGAAFCAWFGITEAGNFEGKSIPNLLGNARFEAPDARMDALCDRLCAYRPSRTRLHRDDKVLTAWNGLMIAALVRAGRALGDPAYLAAARKAERFLAENLALPDGRLRLRWREGEAANDGQLDDYAFYAFALLELYAATFEAGYLTGAARLAKHILTHFADEDGGFFLSAADSEALIARPKEIYDGAMPSGNSVAAAVLDRLARLTGETVWQEARDRQFRFLAGAIGAYPAGYTASLLAFMGVLYPSRELICATAGEGAPEELQALLQSCAVPGLSVLVKTRENQRMLAGLAPFSADYPLPETGAVYYLCQNGACAAPTQSIGDLRKALCGA